MNASALTLVSRTMTDGRPAATADSQVRRAMTWRAMLQPLISRAAPLGSFIHGVHSRAWARFATHDPQSLRYTEEYSDALTARDAYRGRRLELERELSRAYALVQIAGMGVELRPEWDADVTGAAQKTVRHLLRAERRLNDELRALRSVGLAVHRSDDGERLEPRF